MTNDDGGGAVRCGAVHSGGGHACVGGGPAGPAGGRGGGGGAEAAEAYWAGPEAGPGPRPWAASATCRCWAAGQAFGLTERVSDARLLLLIILFPTAKGSGRCVRRSGEKGKERVKNCHELTNFRSNIISVVHNYFCAISTS